MEPLINLSVPELPHSIPAEQAVLGSLLSDNGLYRQLSSKIFKHTFYNAVHKDIWVTISKLIEDGKTVDAIILKNRFSQDETLKDLKDIGGVDYIADLLMARTANEAVVGYAKLLAELSSRRQTIAACDNIKAKLYDPELDNPYSVIDAHISDVARIQRSGNGQQAFADTQDAVAALFSPERPHKIDTGFKALDRIGGVTQGAITLVGGRASMGKSAFLIEAAFNAARRGLRVDLFSMEMSREQIAARAISSFMARSHFVGGLPQSIPYQAIFEQDGLSQANWQRIRSAAKELPTINFDDTPRLNVSDIKARCLDKSGQLDLIFIDYLNIMDLSDCHQADRHDQKLGLVCSRLRDFAKDTGAAIILLCQLNRGAVNRDNNVPQFHDLRDSGELEQHADTVMFVHRQHYYKKRALEAKEAAGEAISTEERGELHALENRFDVIVAKQHMGEMGKACLRCAIEYNYIGDFDVN